MAIAIVIGDEHFKTTNIVEVELFIEKVVELVKIKKPDFIVSLGDLLDSHERLHTIPFNKALEFIDKLRNIAPVYSIVGNHDMTSHLNFLSENHWMNAFKDWKNVFVVDRVINCDIKGMNFTFVPYVYPGRFQEALDTINDKWKFSNCIFAHQEFYGCKMGAIISEVGDKWPLDYPEIISGHIHMKQRPQENIYYTGSAMQHAFGESNKNIIALLTFTPNKKYELEEIDLGLPRKKIIYKNIEEMSDFNISDTKNKIKLSLKGSYEEFKTFKKSNKYKQLTKSGIKIVFTHNTKELDLKEYESEKEKSFSDILKELNKGDENLGYIFDNIIKF